MTRINLVPPMLLTDQHLVAEIKEINQLAGQFSKSVRSKNGVRQDGLPPTYRLGVGHVKFFYNKGEFLRKRFDCLVREAAARRFNINARFSDAWMGYPAVWNQDYVPGQEEVAMSTSRLIDKVHMKDGWYRWYGRPVGCKEYAMAILYGDISFLYKERAA